MARGKGNSTPRSRNSSPVNATKVNGQKINDNQKESKDLSVEQPEKNGVSMNKKMKSSREREQEQSRESKETTIKIKILKNGLSSQSPAAAAAAAANNANANVVSGSIRRAAVAKKSTTKASSKQTNDRKLKVIDGKTDGDQFIDCGQIVNVKMDVNFDGEDSDQSQTEGLKQIIKNIDETLKNPLKSLNEKVSNDQHLCDNIKADTSASYKGIECDIKEDNQRDNSLLSPVESLVNSEFALIMRKHSKLNSVKNKVDKSVVKCDTKLEETKEVDADKKDVKKLEDGKTLEDVQVVKKTHKRKQHLKVRPISTSLPKILDKEESLEEVENLVNETMPKLSPESLQNEEAHVSTKTISSIVEDTSEIPTSNSNTNKVVDEGTNLFKNSDPVSPSSKCPNELSSASNEAVDCVVAESEDKSNALKSDDADEDIMETQTNTEEKSLKRKSVDIDEQDLLKSNGKKLKCSPTLSIEQQQQQQQQDRTMCRRLFGLKRKTHEFTVDETTPTQLDLDQEQQEQEQDQELDQERGQGQVQELEPANTMLGENEFNTSTTIKNNKIYKLSKTELELLIMNKVTEYFTDSDKSEIGALRRRCELLEKTLDLSKRKAAQCQKQLTDLHIVIQRDQLSKKNSSSAKTQMRSVGLQVQLTRFFSAAAAAGLGTASRPTIVGPPATKTSIMTSSTSTPNLPRFTGLPKPSPSGSTFVSSLTNSKNPKTYTLRPSTSTTPNGQISAPIIRPTSLIRIPGHEKTLSVRPVNVGNSQLGVSLLQPKTTNSQAINSNFVFSAPIVTNTINVPNLTNRLNTPPGSFAGLRPHLESGKIVAVTSCITPVPMRLVQNQAARQTAGGGIVSTTTTTTTTSSATPVKSTPQIIKPKLPSVKVIDLTTDEEAAAAAAAAAAKISSSSSSALTTFTINNGMTATLQRNNVLSSMGLTKTVSVLTSAASSPGQILTINPSGTFAATTINSLRMGTPATVATGIGAGSSPAIVNSTGMRYAYLVPSTSVRPNIQTIVLQRGTTLLPLQNQVTTLQGIRPATINVQPMLTTNTMTSASTSTRPSFMPLFIPTSSPVLVQQPQPTSLLTSVTVANISSAVSLSSSSPPPLMTATNGSSRDVAASTMSNSSATSKHPAPLPHQPHYFAKDLVSRKNLPPKPLLKISKVSHGIVLSWNMPMNNTYADICNYQLYAYQESNVSPSTFLWKKVGDVRALPLPMACTLTQFVEGHRYHFAVRAIDTYNRIGPFSEPGSIALMTMTTKSNNH